VQWVWTHYGSRRRNLEEKFADTRYADVTRVRFTHPTAARNWMDVVAPDPSPR